VTDPASLLLAWYDVGHRAMPWRSAPTPYHVLLSEIMLQQTRVDTVIPYFERFIARWPTLEALAAADDDDVLAAWAGLGYYRRARALLAAARAAVARGGLPADPDGLRELPGIGPYTAGAIASIAFGQPAAAVDGNVERVISRLDARREDPTRPAGKRAITARVLELQPADRPGDFNQALMELGATVCAPRNPRCLVCPWREPCRARALGVAEELPIKPKKAAPVAERGVAGVLRLDTGLLLARRAPDRLLGGLWEPPTGPLGDDEEPADAVVALFAGALGVPVAVDAHLGRVVHVFTHRRWTLEVFAVRAVAAAEPRPVAGYDAAGFGTVDDGRALSKLARKILALAGEVP
jgi:A/G-specific adenine glycosylase